jgi:hypothetical protein
METSYSSWYSPTIFSLVNRFGLAFRDVSHRLMEDDVYEGWFIPAGALGHGQLHGTRLSSMAHILTVQLSIEKGGVS